jgi:hypothetical protein
VNSRLVTPTSGIRPAAEMPVETGANRAHFNFVRGLFTWSGALAAVLLAGCSLFAPEPTALQRPAGTEEQTSADLDACRMQADAIILRDASIDRDIGSAREPLAADDGVNDVRANMESFGREQRHRRIVSDCLRQRGYVLPQRSPIAP